MLATVLAGRSSVLNGVGFFESDGLLANPQVNYVCRIYY
jgi:hypothetical protein